MSCSSQRSLRPSFQARSTAASGASENDATAMPSTSRALRSASLQRRHDRVADEGVRGLSRLGPARIDRLSDADDGGVHDGALPLGDDRKTALSMLEFPLSASGALRGTGVGWVELARPNNSSTRWDVGSREELDPTYEELHGRVEGNRPGVSLRATSSHPHRIPLPGRRLHASDEKRNPRRHEDRLGRPDRDGRRRGAARRRVPAGRRRPVSGDPELRSLCQGARLPGGLQERLDAHDHGLSGDRRGLEQQVPELGAGRPGEMGAGRLRHRAGGFARRRPLARLPRGVVAARGQGPPRLRRMGGHAALEQRQGRHQRHFLLRHEPVARGAAAAAAPGGAVHLGRLVRLLPRALPPRRHPVRLPGRLVAPAGHQRAIRRRRRAGRRARSPASPPPGPRLCRRKSLRGTAPTSPARRCGAG